MDIAFDPQPKALILPPDADRLAAHVFARWWLGHCATLVEIVDRPDRAGRVDGPALMFHSLAAALASEDPKFRHFCYANGVRRAEQMLLVIAAGSATVAGDGSCGSGPRAVGDGRDAVRTAARVAGWIGGNPEWNWRTAVGRAHALLSAPRVGAAVDELSELLVAKRRLDRDEIDRICGFWFGRRRPFHDVWAEAWPPTPEQLREAHVPVYHDDEAAVRAMVARLNTAAPSAPRPEPPGERPSRPLYALRRGRGGTPVGVPR